MFPLSRSGNTLDYFGVCVVRAGWHTENDPGQGLLWGWCWTQCVLFRDGWTMAQSDWHQGYYDSSVCTSSLPKLGSKWFLFRDSPGSQPNLHWWGLQTLLRVVSWQAPVGSEASVKILSNCTDSHRVSRLADHSCFSGSAFEKKKRAMGDGKGENP